jgi:hypothetical protein
MKLDIEEFDKEQWASQILVKIVKPQRTRHIKIYIHLWEHLQRTETSYHSTREAKESPDLVQTVLKIRLLYSYNVLLYEYTIVKIHHSLLLQATSVSLAWWQQCCIRATLVVNVFVIHERNIRVCGAKKVERGLIKHLRSSQLTALNRPLYATIQTESNVTIP